MQCFYLHKLLDSNEHIYVAITFLVNSFTLFVKITTIFGEMSNIKIWEFAILDSCIKVVFFELKYSLSLNIIINVIKLMNKFE